VKPQDQAHERGVTIVTCAVVHTINIIIVPLCKLALSNVVDVAVPIATALVYYTQSRKCVRISVAVVARSLML